MTDIGPHGPQVRDEHDDEGRGFDDVPVLEPPTTRTRPDVWTVVMGVVGGALLGTGITLAILGFAGIFYGVTSTVLGVLFVVFSVEVWRNDRSGKAETAAKRLFAFSVLYLFLLFTVLLVEGMGV